MLGGWAISVAEIDLLDKLSSITIFLALKVALEQASLSEIYAPAKHVL